MGKINFARVFSEFYAKKCGNVTHALQLWSNISEDEYDLSILEDFKSYYSLLDKRNEFDTLLSRVRERFNTRGRLRIDLISAEFHNDYDKTLKVLAELDSKKLYEYEFFTQEMYALLCKKDFQSVFQRSNKMLKDITADSDRDSCDMINYQIARKNIGRTIQTEKLDNIISGNSSIPFKVAAYLLLGKQKEANRLLEMDIKFNFIAADQYLSDFVFKEYLNDTAKAMLRAKVKSVY